MTALLLQLAAMWLVCTVLGYAALAPLRPAWRSLWLPAAPALGAALLVVVLHVTGLLVGARTGVVALVPVVVGLALLGVRRGTRPWTVDRGALTALASTSALGLLGAGAALAPSLLLRTDRPVMPTGNHDAFYYISEQSWFGDHAFLHPPVIAAGPGAGTATPFDLPALSSSILPLRFGQPLAAAGLEGILQRPEGSAFMAVMGLWVVVLAGATYVAARLLDGPPAAALCAAALLPVLAVTSRAAFDQHADSLLGIPLALLAVSSVVACVQRRLPRWPAVLALTALVGTYVELLTVVVPACAVTVLALSWRRTRHRLLRAGQLVLLSVLLGPVEWVRGARNLLVSQSGGDRNPSPFLTPDPLLGLARAIGVTPVQASLLPAGAVVTRVLLVVGLVGLVALVVLSRHRAPLGVLGLGCAVLWTYATVTGRGYLQDRAVTLVVPLLALLVVLGWGLGLRALVRRVRRTGRPAGALRLAITVVAVALVVASVQVNLMSTSSQVDLAYARSRVVTAEYDEVASWVRQLGGPQGSDVTVADPDFFTQLWLTYSLRDERDVSYLSLFPSYLQPERYWNGETDRYVLVGPGAWFVGPDRAVVRRSTTFRLVDLDVPGTAVLTMGNRPTWSIRPAQGRIMTCTWPCSLVQLTRDPTTRFEARIASRAPVSVVGGPTSLGGLLPLGTGTGLRRLAESGGKAVPPAIRLLGYQAEGSVGPTTDG